MHLVTKLQKKSARSTQELPSRHPEQGGLEEEEDELAAHPRQQPLGVGDSSRAPAVSRWSSPGPRSPHLSHSKPYGRVSSCMVPNVARVMCVRSGPCNVCVLGCRLSRGFQLEKGAGCKKVQAGPPLWMGGCGGGGFSWLEAGQNWK